MFSLFFQVLSECLQRKNYGIQIFLMILIATLLQIGFWARLGVGGDQNVILDLGTAYAESGVLEPSTKPTSGDGRVPGVLLTYFVGTSLRVSSDHRLPAALLVVTNAASLVVLGVTMKGLVGGHLALWFLALYGLSPWRLFNASMLWEPAFLFLPASLHFAACAMLRNRRRVDASFVLGLSLAIAFQFHASFLVLLVATGILVIRKSINLHWPVFILGGFLGGLPFLLSALATEGEAFGFAPQFKDSIWAVLGTSARNIPKALLYWLRMGSADVGRRFAETFLPAIVSRPLGVLALGSVLVPAVSAVRQLQGKISERDAGEERWLLKYAAAFFFALLISAAVSPVTMQGWHAVVALHAACIPPSLFLATLWTKKHDFRQVYVFAFFGIIVASSLVLLFGHPLSTG